MAADLHIHVLNGDLTEADFKAFFHNTIGSHYEDLDNEELSAEKDKVFFKFADSKSFEVGKVWQEHIDAVDALIPEYPHPMLTPELTRKIMEAFNIPAVHRHDSCDEHALLEFLRKNVGKQIFTVAW